MTLQNWLLLLVQGGIPVLLLGWQGLPAKSQLGWLLKTLTVGGYLLAVGLISLWIIVFPWWVPGIYGLVWGLLALAGGYGCRQQPRWPKPWSWTTAKLAGLGLLVGLLSAVILQALQGYWPAEPSVMLDFPLASGTYYIAHGGSRELINGHLKTLAPRLRDYRGQSYGLDVARLNWFGTRTTGLPPRFLPADVQRYAIFGDPVYAPCSGTAVKVERGQPDMIPPEMDRDPMAGNSVLLRCEQADVLLAHLRQGTVAVDEGQAVATGQRLGEVGNSGNSSEPHLHIHAQTPATGSAPLGGDPLSIRFNRRYLVRGSRITQTAFVEKTHG